MPDPDYVRAEMAAQSLASHCAQARAFQIVRATGAATSQYSEDQAIVALATAASVLGYSLVRKQSAPAAPEAAE